MIFPNEFQLSFIFVSFLFDWTEFNGIIFKSISFDLMVIDLLCNCVWIVLLPPAKEVCEGYVFTGVCLSTGGRTWHACPQAHTTPGYACPSGHACTLSLGTHARPLWACMPPGHLNLLLECILVFIWFNLTFLPRVYLTSLGLMVCVRSNPCIHNSQTWIYLKF